MGARTSTLNSRLLAALIALLAGAGVNALNADDWPQWRGNLRDGIWREEGLVTRIPADGLKVRWRTRIGQGYSGPAVADGKVFLTERRREPDRERVVCFREDDGAVLWAHEYRCEYADMEYGNGPRTTPTVREGRVYTLGTKGHLYCFDASGGAVIWKKDLVAELGAREPRYGVSAAPIVVDDFLIVCGGAENDGSVVAFDRFNGEERWRAIDDKPAYSAPILIERGGARQLIVWTAQHINSLDPKTGRIFWQSEFKTTFDPAQATATPVLRDDRLLCLAGWGRGSVMFRLDGEKPAATILWKTRRHPTTTLSTPWFPGAKHFYATLNNGSLACLDAGNGDEVWSTQEATGERMGTAHLIPVGAGSDGGGRVFLFNQKGQLILANLSPDGYEETGRCLLVEATAAYRPQGPVAWAHPAFANRRVFARNDRDLVCASLAAADYPEPESPAVTRTNASESAKPVRTIAGLAGRSSAAGLAISPDGKLFAAGTWGGQIKLRDWPAAPDTDLPAPKKLRFNCTAVAVSPDGSRVAAVGGNEFQKNAELLLWDVAAEKEIARLPGHNDKLYAVAFSPDGTMIATGAADRVIKLWDVRAATLKERLTLTGHSDCVSGLAFSPDGKSLVSAGWDGTIRLWATSSGESRGVFAKIDGEEILAVAVSPDGKQIAAGATDWTVRLHDAESKGETARFEGHRGAVYSVAFSPDGKTLASGGGDQVVKIWDTVKETETATLRGHQSGVAMAVFHPDGKHLISAGRDDAARVWAIGE